MQQALLFSFTCSAIIGCYTCCSKSFFSACEQKSVHLDNTHTQKIEGKQNKDKKILGHPLCAAINTRCMEQGVEQQYTCVHLHTHMQTKTFKGGQKDKCDYPTIHTALHNPNTHNKHLLFIEALQYPAAQPSS